MRGFHRTVYLHAANKGGSRNRSTIFYQTIASTARVRKGLAKSASHLFEFLIFQKRAFLIDTSKRCFLDDKEHPQPRRPPWDSYCHVVPCILVLRAGLGTLGLGMLVRSSPLLVLPLREWPAAYGSLADALAGDRSSETVRVTCSTYFPHSYRERALEEGWL
jgi:hypothetical protein